MSPQSASANRAVLEHYREILRDGDYDAMPEVLAPDFVQEMPQSGERIVGIANFVAVVRGITSTSPTGGLEVAMDPYVAGDEEHFVITPTFNVVKVADAGDEITSYVKAKFPDGSEWYIVSFTSFRDGKIVKGVDFFAPVYEAPAWRAEWVRPM